MTLLGIYGGGLIWTALVLLHMAGRPKGRAILPFAGAIILWPLFWPWVIYLAAMKK